MSKKANKFVKIMPLLIAMSLIIGCQSADTIVIDDCASFGLIYPSRKDTTETVRQVLNHNEIYETICPMGAIDSEQKHRQRARGD